MIENFEIIHYKEVTSTNDIAKKIIDENKNFCNKVIFADYQTQGRGYATNTWISDYGQNFLMSIIICPELAAHQQFYISKAISLEIIEYLKNKNIRAKIKWPNDILVNQNKIAGILIENSILGNNIQSSIIGIGLNINQVEFHGVSNVTSLHKENGTAYDLTKELNIFLSFRTKFLNLCINKNFEELDELYFSNLFGTHNFHKYRDKTGTFQAIVRGVDEFGRLVLTDKKQQKRTYGFKEVELIQ